MEDGDFDNGSMFMDGGLLFGSWGVAFWDTHDVMTYRHDRMCQSDMKCYNSNVQSKILSTCCAETSDL